MPKISLSMIVKNEETSLPRCLNSVNDVVDEIIIVDTGSTDNTINIAQEFGAKIFNYTWNDDFSAARNFALRNSTGNFILYLDADEELSNNCKNELLKLSETSDKIGYYCTVRSIDEYSKQDNTIRYIRFFKNSDSIRFNGKVHEQITDSLVENNYKLIHSDIEIIHYGYNISSKDKSLKAERNLKLLLKEYSNNQKPYIAFQIAQSYFILKNFTEAEKFFNISLTSNSLSKDLQSESYYYLAQISHNKFDIVGSENNIKNAIRLNDKKPFHHYLYAKILQRKQDYSNALNAYKKALELNKRVDKIHKENLQTVLLNKTEVIFSGINLSLKLNDKRNLDFFLNELSFEIDSRFSHQKHQYSVFIKILSSNKAFSANDLESIYEIINDENLETTLFIIDKTADFNLKVDLLEKLHKKFSENLEIIKRLALAYDTNNLTEKSITLFNSNYQKVEEDPSALFYFSSFLIKKNQLEKALEIFDLISKNFPHIYQLNPKMKEIKEKISKAIKI